MKKRKYLVRINYVNGQSEQFWCYSFDQVSPGVYKWEAVDKGGYRPILIGENQISSIWQLRSELA